MTQKEISRLRVINQTIDGVLTIREAAELLDLSERQVLRLNKGVVDEGPAFIIHKNRGRKPKHATTDDIKDLIIELKQTKYEEANFNHFHELIEEHEDVTVSYPTVHRILTEAGIKSPKKHRKRKAHHRRKRKPQKGMLVQIDASQHKWIIGSDPFDLHGAIDDATGEILALYFIPNECMEGYFEIVRQIVSNHGIPTSIYCDRHPVFVPRNYDKLSIEDQLDGKTVNLTQFGRAMDELGINLIKAYSPQANSFLSEFMIKYNQKFGVSPEDATPAFRALGESINLDYILCIKKERMIIENAAFSYDGKYYQLMINDKVSNALPKAKLTVLTSTKFGIKAMYSDVVYDTRELDERPKKAISHQPKEKIGQAKPPRNHPWRIALNEKTMPYGGNSLYEPDTEIDEILKGLFNSTRAWA